MLPPAGTPGVESLPSREGSRLYSYLLMGQNHDPETTQPTTSPCTNITERVLQDTDISFEFRDEQTSVELKEALLGFCLSQTGTRNQTIYEDTAG